jgi:hypothetical protein
MPASHRERTPWELHSKPDLPHRPRTQANRGSRKQLRSTLGTGSFALSSRAVPSATKRAPIEFTRCIALRHRGQISYFVIHGPLSTSRRRLYRCVNNAAQTAPARTTRNQIMCSCYVMLREKLPDGIGSLDGFAIAGDGLLRSGGASLHARAGLAIELTY